jgi:hypothetical protein
VLWRLILFSLSLFKSRLSLLPCPPNTGMV